MSSNALVRKYFYDLEFLEDGYTIDLISIGMVCEDGREYYAVNSDMPVERIGNHDWLCKNVVPHIPVNMTDKSVNMLRNAINGMAEFNRMNPLTFQVDKRITCVKPKFVIANEVQDFLFLPGVSDKIVHDPELWAYRCAYDHVGLCQLWGALVHTPPGLPRYTNELASLRKQLGYPDIPEQDKQGAHHALNDAKYNMAVYHHLMSLPR